MDQMTGQFRDAATELRANPVELELVWRTNAQHVLTLVIAQECQGLDPSLVQLRRHFGLELRRAGEPTIIHGNASAWEPNSSGKPGVSVSSGSWFGAATHR